MKSACDMIAFETTQIARQGEEKERKSGSTPGLWPPPSTSGLFVSHVCLDYGIVP